MLALAKRIARMSSDEISTRVRQAASSRADALRHYLGLAPVQPKLGGSGSPGKFFFDAAGVPALAREWAGRNPEAVERTIAQADEILRHRFSLLGYRALDFGDPIDWNRDPVHGIRSPMKPWRSIPFLDFRSAGDHKIVWELSRHQHLVTLARAWRYSGDRRYLDEAIAQWRDWQRRNPYPLGINWASSLEVAFRILSWIWIDHLMAAGPEDLAAAIGHGARYIERYLSTYFAPNTHLLGEAVALFFAGTLYPQFRDAPRWREQGWKIVLEQSRAQVREDGFHFEQSVYYHVYALDFFIHARALAARNGLSSSELDAVIERMSAALRGISQTGLAPRFGDDDGGRLFDPSRNRAEHMFDPLTLTEESFWLGASLKQPAKSALHSQSFPQSGYYAFASHDALLVADAGPHGYARGGHAHADALSVQLLCGPRALLSDPGAGVYPAELPLRDRLRATSAHSTLEVDGRSQAEPAGSFAWSTHPRTTVERCHFGRRADLFTASHDGYQRLPDPILHRRWIVGWKPSGWLVRDLALGRGRHRFDLRWRLSPDGATVTIAPAEGLDWQTNTEQAEYSPAYGEIVMAPVVRLHRECEAPVEAATVLSTADAKLHRVHASPAIYHWTDAAGERYLWFRTEPGHQRAFVWQTDAAFALLALDSSGAPACLCLADATYFTIAGQELFRSPQPADFVELLPGDARWNPSSFIPPGPDEE
jgi:Heparinase II/III-like protein/Heparinase II/III N-terminus